MIKIVIRYKQDIELNHTAGGKVHENVKKGVSSVMGGKVLEYEAKTIKNEGIQEGLQKGLQKGRM